MAGTASVGHGGVVLLALTPKLEVAEGGRVFGGPGAVLAAAIGVAVGVAVGRYLRRRR